MLERHSALEQRGGKSVETSDHTDLTLYQKWYIPPLLFRGILVTPV